MKRECFDDFDTRKRLRPDGAGGGWEKVGMKRRQWDGFAVQKRLRVPPSESLSRWPASQPTRLAYNVSTTNLKIPAMKSWWFRSTPYTLPSPSMKAPPNSSLAIVKWQPKPSLQELQRPQALKGRSTTSSPVKIPNLPREDFAEAKGLEMEWDSFEPQSPARCSPPQAWGVAKDASSPSFGDCDMD